MYFFSLIIVIACMLAVPTALLYFTGEYLVGPLLWMAQRYQLSAGTTKQLPAGAQLLPRDDSAAVKEILDLASQKAKPKGAFDHFAELDALRVFKRTTLANVDRNGEDVGFPWTRRQRKESEQAMTNFWAVDLREVLAASPKLHFELWEGGNIVGDEALAAGLLDSAFWDATALGDVLTIDDGFLCVTSPFAERDGRAGDLTRALLGVAQRLLSADLRSKEGTARLLLERLDDPSAKLRSQVIELLLNRFEGTEEARLAKARALEDPYPQVRFAAARHMGEEAFEIIVTVIEDESADDGLRQRALRNLLNRFPLTRTQPLLRRILVGNADEERSQRPALSGLESRAAQYLGEQRCVEAIPWMEKAAQTADTVTAVQIARALENIQDPGASAVLVRLFRRRTLEVKIAAAEALGAVGGLDAVALLKPIASSSNVDPELRVAASTAVGLIQSRHGPASAGALAVVGSGGELSVGVGEAGTLSAPSRPASDDDDTNGSAL